ASPIHDPYGIEWINVIVIPESDFMADINANKRTTIFLIIIAVLLALVLGVYTARWISKPILRLNKSTQSLIKGEFKTIDIERVREIDQLGHSFNFMAKQLEQTILKLKTQINKRKQNEEALKKSEKKHREILEGLNDAAYRMSVPDGKYEYFSQSSKNVFGYKAEEWTNNPLLIQKIIHPDFIGYFKQKWSDILQGEIADTYEYKIIDPEGNERWIFQSNKGSFDDQEKIIAIEGLCRDITDHKKAELALRKSEEQLRTIFEAATEVSVIITDTHELDPIVLEFSPGAENIFGYNRAEMIGNQVSVLHPPDDVAIFSENYKRLQEGKKVFSSETTLIRKSGEKFPALFSAYPLFDENGKIYAVLEVSIDIGERKKFEKQLQQTQKMDAISTLAGGIAHDFNNLLGVITGNVSYSLSLLNQGEELFEVLLDVQDGVKQAQSLTHQLLTFSKGGEPIKKTADINQLLIESAQFVIRGAKTRCEFELSENLSMAEIDPGQINQVISNLVINARQAMPHGGTVLIRTENVELETENNLSLPSGLYIRIIVEDQGIGISEKHLSKIFDPFFTTKQKGNGLGLSTVYSIIQKHKGQITVCSEIEKGTVFYVYLPASLKELEKNEDKLESIHQGHGKILIMDDQEPILKMVGRMLNRMGYETIFASDGAQTIEIYLDAYQSGNPFDLVILDLTVPGGMGGAKTIPELLKIDPEVKAIVSSGYSNNPIMSNYEDYGFCGVVPKPYTKSQLSEVLNKIFDEKR
ncbi:PAS domain S-box protein, partial [Desulfobacterales bacterium HSG16]|nr:PAS domain S-box protein [Desulfobacterales bacterium HSG16]